jgi:hypothetical protein
MKMNLDDYILVLSRVYPLLSNGLVNTPHNILVDVQKTRLQKVLKLVTLYLEKQAYKFAPCKRMLQPARQKTARTGQAGIRSVLNIYNVAKFFFHL